ncbi:hypothetical protein N8K70_03870 [Microbacterium betulae]|uniref:Uncharacterized protein n=1 Tax=Microbacterium betulae TaxID=2981139 RepID=A0AA97FIF9_9MICO|nr:hypothetical protein [Microbacterium sp. AB]WOF23828.1 hypothetical protein N8K70_03870 [Microbacterium sp. AB]
MAEGGKVEIKMLTERKVLPVQSGWLADSADRVEVDVCLECGAVVFDVVRHDEWHEAKRKPFKSRTAS